MKDKILVSQSLHTRGEWIITTPNLYNFLRDETKSQHQFDTFYEALEFISGEKNTAINIVSHGSKDFLEIGKGYTTLDLEREFSNRRNHKFDLFNLNLWSCYGGANNGIRDSLERCLNIKINAKNGRLGKGESLENIEPTKLNESIKNLPITLHTNAVGFDVIDNGNGTFGLVVYYGTWHRGSESQSVESALSLYTLASGGDPTNPDDYTVEAYGQGGAINNQTYYFTNPPKNTGNITFTTTDFNTTDTTYLEGGGATGLSDKGFTPGTNLFFASYSASSLTSYNSTNGTSLESGYSGTYGFQSAFIPTLSPGTYRAYYDGFGSWDSTEPLNAPDITAVYHPVTLISSALITIDGSGDISFGEPPKILVNSVDGDNGASTTDFVTSGRGVVIRGTYDTTASLSADSLQVDITNTTTSSTTSYTTSSSELSASAGAWTLTLGSELTPANYTVSSKINTASDGSGTEYTNDQTLSIVAGSVEAITKDDGISSIDLKTTDTTVIIDGIYSASTNSSISITVTDSSSNTIVNAQSPTSTSGDVWYYDLTGTTLSIDTYTVTASIEDSAGSFTTSRNFQVIDGPTAPATTAIADDSGTTGDFITTDTSLTISGTFDATDDASNSDTDGKLQVTLAGLTYTDTGSNDLVVDYTNGTWSFTPSSDLSIGSYSVLAEITDANGNYNSSSQNILVADASDTTAPTAPTIDSIDEDTDTAGDFTTTDTSLTITGTFDASDYAGGFTVSYGDTTFTMGTDTELVASGNTWTLTYPSTAATGSLVATATDAGGNESSASQLITVNSTDVIGEKLDVSSHQIGQTYHLEYIKDFDGNLHGNTSTITDSFKNSYKYQGNKDVNNDGVVEAIYTNRRLGRWATGTVDSLTGEIDYSKYGQGGATRVVGVYKDPLIELGIVEQFGSHDSSTRFQNDLYNDNLTLKTSGDYDGDGFQEVYWKTNDGDVYLRSLMHADGNIQYANYQNQTQMSDYLTGHGYQSVISDII